MQFDTNWTTWPFAVQILVISVPICGGLLLLQRFLPRFEWISEYGFALISTCAGAGMLASTALKLLRQPSWGEAVWLVVWLMVGPALVQAGRNRWRRADALRLAPKSLHA